jgi:hypothetical protein
MRHRTRRPRKNPGAFGKAPGRLSRNALYTKRRKPNTQGWNLHNPMKRKSFRAYFNAPIDSFDAIQHLEMKIGLRCEKIYLFVRKALAINL